MGRVRDGLPGEVSQEGSTGVVVREVVAGGESTWEECSDGEGEGRGAHLEVDEGERTGELPADATRQGVLFIRWTCIPPVMRLARKRKGYVRITASLSYEIQIAYHHEMTAWLLTTGSGGHMEPIGFENQRTATLRG